jgi:hypothetical protein
VYNSRIAEILKFKTTNSFSNIDYSGITNNYVKFNEAIGLPYNRNTGLPQAMTVYQIEYHDAIQIHHKVIVNKSRKIGATEAGIRSIASNIYERYAGHDIMIVAGNELRIAKEILKRMDQLFYENKEGYAYVDSENKYRRDEIIRKAKYGNSPEIEFCNDTRVMAFAALKTKSSQSFRGTDDVACIFVSEAAHTGMKDDHVIMTALEPNLANRDDGDFILESTPNGKRGFFYNYWKSAVDPLKKKYHTVDDRIAIRNLKNDTIDLDWYPLMWDYTEGVKHGVLSAKFLESQKNSPKLDFDQEYRCSFTSPYTQAIKTSDLTFKDSKQKDYSKSKDLLKEIGRNYGSPTEFYRS